MGQAKTQDHLLIKTIKDDFVYLKNGDVALVLQTNAVNFGLLSEMEQMAIIGAFAGLINSLSFAIQIVIRSKRLNISSYLDQLDQAREKQKNPLLSQMILRYRNFIARTIRENEVLDKQFYVVITISGIEIGFTTNPDERLKRIRNILIPRRDHIIRQLASIGLQARQLETKELIKLFYDIYNGSFEMAHAAPEIIESKEKQPKVANALQPVNPIKVNVPLQEPSPVRTIPSPSIQQPQKFPPRFQPTQASFSQSFLEQHLNPNLRTSPLPTMQTEAAKPPTQVPFVVEEVKEDYGAF